jgi:hypothetical protein
VTAKVSFQKSEFLQTPQAPPPTFLFLLIFNCQKTDDPCAVAKSTPQTSAQSTNQHSANPLDFLQNEKLRRQQRRRPRQ